MNYDEELAKELQNPDGYLYFSDSSIHSYLDGVADDFYNKNSADGYIAAVLIWHQLIEEILRLIYRYSHLLIRAGIYPVKIEGKNLNDESLGALIQINKQCVEYEGKSKIMKSAKEINRIRNELFHGIIKSPTEDMIIEKAKPIKEYFQELMKEWQNAMKWFYKEIEKARKRESINRLLTRYIKNI